MICRLVWRCFSDSSAHPRTASSAPVAGPLVFPAKAPTTSKQQAASSVKPRALPGAPFFLTNYVIPLKCEPAAARGALHDALATAKVDYEYNPSKWKVRRMSGCAAGAGAGVALPPTLYSLCAR
jgi:hypothetical protein